MKTRITIPVSGRSARAEGECHGLRADRRVSPRRILVPVDFSEASLSAMRYAFEIANRSATVHLVHVVEPGSFVNDLGNVPLAKDDRQLVREAREHLEQLARGSLKGVETEITVRIGKPAKEICAIAAELGTELIVIPTHGYSGWKRLLFGSTTEDVVRGAPCPVLTIREQVLSGAGSGPRRLLISVH